MPILSTSSLYASNLNVGGIRVKEEIERLTKENEEIKKQNEEIKKQNEEMENKFEEIKKEILALREMITWHPDNTNSMSELKKDFDDLSKLINK